MKTPEEIDQELKRLDAELEKQCLIVAVTESTTLAHRPSIPQIERKKLATLRLEKALLLDSKK